MSELYKRKCENWLHTYLEYTSEQESPTEFHLWTSMAILSATLGRHVWIDRGYYTIYPNLFIILVAGSAKCRKSVSTHMGLDLLYELRDKPMVFSQKITNEALIQALSEAKVDNSSAGLIYASELSVFMGVDAHHSGLIPTLTDLYDSPAVWSYRTRSRGIEELTNVSLCMLAASTADWLRTSIPVDAVGGGFTSRIVFVYQDKPKKPILFPKRHERTAELRAALVSDLNHIRTLRGQLDFTPEAREFAEKWYAEESQKERDSKLEGYYGRKHDTMFKISAILCLAESDDLWIQTRHVTKALSMMNENETMLGLIVASVTATETGSITEKILNLVRREGKITHSALLKHCWRFSSALEMSEHLKTLLESKELEESFDGNSRCYEVRKSKLK